MPRRTGTEMDAETDSEMSDGEAPPPTALKRGNAIRGERNTNGEWVYTTRSHSPARSVLTATDLGTLTAMVEARRNAASGIGR